MPRSAAPASRDPVTADGASPRLVKVATTDELSPGEMRTVEVEGRCILVVNLGGSCHAVDDTCTHSSASLSEGELDGDELMCPYHGSVFSARTGEVLLPPAKDPLSVYPVEVRGKDILVDPVPVDQQSRMPSAETAMRRRTET